MAILITGTSSGIGRAAVEYLATKGHHVVATARNVGDIKDLAGDHVDIMPLDVTKEPSLVAAVDQTIADHGRIDALVNNAGFGAYLPLEQTPDALMRDMFDVNVFGLHRLTQVVLPHMRAQEKQRGWRGRIVNVSSAAGHISLPMMSSYCATKHAVRAMTQALHAEVRPHGIHAALIEPGRIRTRFGERARAESTAPPETAYPEMYRNFDKALGEGRGRSPQVIARRIGHACTARRPRFHYLAPIDAKAANVVKRIMPDWVLNTGMRAYFWR